MKNPLRSFAFGSGRFPSEFEDRFDSFLCLQNCSPGFVHTIGFCCAVKPAKRHVQHQYSDTWQGVLRACHLFNPSLQRLPPTVLRI